LLFNRERRVSREKKEKEALPLLVHRDRAGRQMQSLRKGESQVMTIVNGANFRNLEIAIIIPLSMVVIP